MSINSTSYMLNRMRGITHPETRVAAEVDSSRATSDGLACEHNPHTPPQLTPPSLADVLKACLTPKKQPEPLC